jgi:hypothetical protein
LLRPGTDGTVIGGSFAVSFPAAAVEDAVPADVAFGVEEAVATTGVELASAGPPSVERVSEPGVGRASLLAAHANAPNSPNINVGEISRRFIEKYCISFGQKLLRRHR